MSITIRDVPEEVRDRIAARAADARQSMQEYLRAELERLASGPSIDAWLRDVRARKRTTMRRVPAKVILRHRDADRR